MAILGSLALGLLLGAHPARAASCVDLVPGDGITFDWFPDLTTDLADPACNCACAGNPTTGFWCYEARLSGPQYTPVPAGCDPRLGFCGVVASVYTWFPGNDESLHVVGSGPRLEWRDGANLIGRCGASAGTEIFQDTGRATIGRPTPFSCTTPSAGGTYTFRVIPCFGGSDCPHPPADQPVSLADPDIQVQLCADEPTWGCNDDASCSVCLPESSGGSGVPTGVSVAGRGASISVPDGGPGATLRYRAGGVGHPFFPGSPAWNPMLGRGWSHDYAERIVLDPDDAHVWLLTRWGTFREFTDAVADPEGLYEEVAPSDEQRRLHRTAGGWELRGLDGTVVFFASGGLWDRTEDRNGNTTDGAWNGGQLETVSFPDGRSETFTYHAGGKLASITEVGVGGAATRTWTYTWVGPDLARIDRPDGRFWEFRYGRQGFLARVDLAFVVSSSLTVRRIERAWDYDDFGNVVRTWKGAAAFTDPGAVDRWELAFDDPLLPTVTTVTDPLGNLSTYELERDTVSDKPKVVEISGSCPVCALGPNSRLFYDDPAHPLRVTRTLDGEGHETHFTYDARGMMTSRTEAVGDPDERLTEWEYHPAFPAFPTSIEGPTPAGAPPTRRLDLGYDPATGDLLTRTASGLEATYPGGVFVLPTASTYNAAGQPLTVDPPGYPTPGPTDVTGFTYDPARGDLLPLTRTDPLVGTTGFGYDAFNRRTGATDPNGVQTETCYDALNRVTLLIEHGGTPAQACTPVPGDLATRHVYSRLGDLHCTVLPRGNALQYFYDAAGRLTEIQRGTAVASPTATTCLNAALARERTLYTLDAFGHRVNEKLERWSGAAWVTEAETSFAYSTRCHLDQVIQAPGRPEEATTEYAYDCNGRLQRVWDANHPSGGQSNPATQVYVYDALDRLTSVTQPWAGAGGGSAVTAYAYDAQDHLTAVTDAEGNLTSYAHSDRDLLTSEVSPASGTTTHRYTDHGELIETTDARGIVVARTVDPLDRVTLVDYPADALDVTYAYDLAGACAQSFPLGRLGSIARGEETVSYCHDRFGRLTQDGDLGYAYDANGNRTGVVYPGSVGPPVTAVYGFDFADRPTSLVAQRPGFPDQPLVTAASYKPAGPLASLTLGNGLAETRSFDARYAPTGIALAGGAPLDWDYTTDPVGNVLAIADALAPAGSRSFAYQDVHYFLSCAAGPWAPPGAACAPPAGEPLAWTYDRIGNRLTEVRGGLADTYDYAANPAGGNTPLLSSIQLGLGGTRSYQYGPAGHLEQVDAAGNLVAFSHDEAGQLGRLERPAAAARADFLYDGRGFLARALDGSGGYLFADGFETGDLACWSAVVTGPSEPDPGDTGSAAAKLQGDKAAAAPRLLGAGTCLTAPHADSLYSSEGLLHGLDGQSAIGAPPRSVLVFSFAGRPVAQLARQEGGPETWTFLTTDHLGTPIVATNTAAGVGWSGGFEPFGADWQAGTPAGATENGIFLRLPGQWVDGAWEEASLGAPLFYNVFRWYGPAAARFARTDPLAPGGERHPYSYAAARPTLFIDPKGLTSGQPEEEPPEPACTNCDPHTKEIHVALKAVCRNTQSSTCRNLLASDGLLDCFTQRCRSPIPIVCVSQKGSCGGCGGACNNLSDPTKRIFLQPGAFTPICGNLARTLAHELGHMCGIGADVIHRENRRKAESRR